MAKRAWSFSERGSTLSLSGRINDHVREAPTRTDAWARASIGPIVIRSGVRWNSLAGGAWRGAQTTLIIKRIL